MTKRSDQNRKNAMRLSLSILGLLAIAPVWAGSGEADAASQVAAMERTVHLLIGIAVVQMIFIVVLASIMRNLVSSNEMWTKYRDRIGKAGMLLALFALPAVASAAGTDAPFLLMKVNNLFWLAVVVNFILFVIVVILLGILKGMIRNMRDDVSAEGVVEEDEGLLSALSVSLTKRVDMEHEEDVLMDHEYDGIHELDNVLPPWWLWLFYGTVIFAVIYLFGFHVLKIWPSSDEEFAIAMEEGRQQVEAYRAQQPDLADENTVSYVVDPGALKNGEELYTQLCVACHLADGAGGIGPNFTDEYWIHGCDIKDVFSTIKYGVPEKGMISWKTQMKPAEMQNVASYILNAFQTGEPVANGKEPQGEVCDPFAPGDPEPATEEVEMPVDSVTNDTLVTAMLP